MTTNPIKLSAHTGTRISVRGFTTVPTTIIAVIRNRISSVIIFFLSPRQVRKRNFDDILE